MNRDEILSAAAVCVCGSREEDYGNPADNFRVIADLWSTYIGGEITPLDVAMMMALLKIARISTGRHKDDSFVDACGYISIAGEISGTQNSAHA